LTLFDTEPRTEHLVLSFGGSDKTPLAAPLCTCNWQLINVSMRCDVQPPQLKFALAPYDSNQQQSACVLRAATQHGVADPAVPRLAGTMVVACGARVAGPTPARGHARASEQQQRGRCQGHATSATIDAAKQAVPSPGCAQAWRASAAEGTAAPCSSGGVGGSSTRHRQQLLSAGSSRQRQRGLQPTYDRRLASMSARFISITGLQVRTSAQLCSQHHWPKYLAWSMRQWLSPQPPTVEKCHNTCLQATSCSP
jgi:hypothetical protein